MPVLTSKTGSNLSSSFQSESENREFGDRLKKAREKLGLSQRELAEKISSNKNTVQRYESGQLPKGDKLLAISYILGCSLDWLLKGEGEKKTNVAYMDHATQLIHEVEEEVGIRLNDRQRKAVVEILRDEIDRRNQESKERIASLLTSFKEG